MIREESERNNRSRRGRHAVLLVALKTISLYSFAGWAYIAMNAIFHPATLKLPLSHLLSWPHEDTFGAICFVVSASSFFCLQLLERIDKAKDVP